jgi:hypothetical protein
MLYTGNLPACISWACGKANEKNLLIPIYVVRAGEKEARLIYEVCKKGIRPIYKDHYVKILKGARWEAL